ncbi:hypothetical protein GQX74_000838 [Glossina fuscipes]|nr:hypothetical protein GQX74_000838 [Glossina fuscipes]
MTSKIPAFSVILLLILKNSIYLRAEDDKPPYKVVLDKLVKEKEAEHIVKTDLTFDKVDSEVLVNGQMEQLVDLDNNYKSLIIIHHADEPEGEYKKIMTLPKKGICELMQKQYKNYFYESLKEHANAPDPDACPIVKETYVIKDYPLDSSKMQKFLRPGYYRIEGFLYHNDQDVLKYSIYAHVDETSEAFDCFLHASFLAFVTTLLHCFTPQLVDDLKDFTLKKKIYFSVGNGAIVDIILDNFLYPIPAGHKAKSEAEGRKGVTLFYIYHLTLDVDYLEFLEMMPGDGHTIYVHD